MHRLISAQLIHNGMLNGSICEFISFKPEVFCRWIACQGNKISVQGNIFPETWRLKIHESMLFMALKEKKLHWQRRLESWTDPIDNVFLLEHSSLYHMAVWTSSRPLRGVTWWWEQRQWWTWFEFKPWGVSVMSQIIQVRINLETKLNLNF